jgi:hypothetical protein
MKHTVLVNYVLYQTGWFACILGGAWHFPLTGLAIALGAIAAHLWLTRERAIEVRLIAIATAAGLLIEIFHLRTGTYRMTSGTIVENFPPPWMLALWAQFATTFRYSLRGIISRPALAGLFGVLGAPLAFLAGDRLGALTLLPPETAGLERLAISWGVAMYAFALIVRRVPSEAGSPVYR